MPDASARAAAASHASHAPARHRSPSFAIAANTASAVSGTILLARVPRARAQSDLDQIDALESPDIGCFPDARMPAA
ncbi:hypothetical protein GNZ25_20650 [Burkholderia thailandensis]|uniref:hypothetical protein n=1 Tax=Burkholderia thailandensis TaxID=57975 RepID=UPI0012E80A81|nr:hypothetical protein [Burkholderia thailandensis]MUV23711.1 hypothetical protein [Burkholderia thailandensis]